MAERDHDKPDTHRSEPGKPGDERLDRLTRITTEPAPQETGEEAEATKAAQKAVAMGRADDPETAARASAADRDRGGGKQESEG
ncbi:MAG TPA: hypothetical protein VEB20_05815 [Azospirillaceae bacterium]|nr:hypothetical protein [Azospirillaceae bacterium]